MKKKGFTLVELMMTLAVFTIFSIYLYQTFFLQIRQSFEFKDNIDIQYDANKALNMIADQIRSCDSINDTKILRASDGKTIISLGPKDKNGQIQVSVSKGNFLNDGDTVELIKNQPELDLPLSDVQYNIKEKMLKDDNEDKCYNIDKVDFSYENGLVNVTVSASEGKLNIKMSTAVNVQKS